jgi:hypothetical protein
MKQNSQVSNLPAKKTLPPPDWYSCSVSRRSFFIECGLSAGELFQDVVCFGGPDEGFWAR